MEQKKSFISRLDENVIFTMLAVSVIACIILAFKYKSYEPCLPITIRTSVPFGITTIREHYKTGDNIRFETNAHANEKLRWDFGDNSKEETKNASIFHTYNVASEYTVTVTSDKGCVEFKMLTIIRAPKTVSPNLIIPEFIYTDSAEVGKPDHFEDTTVGVTRWKWRYGDSQTEYDTIRNPSHTYQKTGTYIVSLTIDNNPEQFNSHKVYVTKAVPKVSARLAGAGTKTGKDIHVKPDNDDLSKQTDTSKSEDQVVTAPDVTEAELISELRGVANRDSKYPIDYFSKYTCNAPKITVKLNGKDTDFEDFYNRLHELGSADEIRKNQFKIQIAKFDKTNCIWMLIVKCRKKSKIFNTGNTDL